MNGKKWIPGILATVCIGLASGSVAALELHSVPFPERKEVDLRFSGLPGAPEARMGASVEYRNRQARIQLWFEAMKPAILFGGDVTCYVLWAVTPSGETENLGELLVPEPKGELVFSTGKKKFAMLVTAEPYYLVNRPSSLVVFRSDPSREKKAPSEAFDFSAFAPEPKHAMKSISQIAWDSKIPLVLLQARKAHELAARRDAAKHAPRVFAEAEGALNRANDLAKKSPQGRQTLDYATRAVALSNEAIIMSIHRLESIELERKIAERRAEMASLETRASEAETAALEAKAALDNARRAADAARLEQEALAVEIESLRREQSSLERTTAELKQQQKQLKAEKTQLRGKLEEALSHVAETRETARGIVVNLPDILFDVNQATLKPETRTVLAKLAGILLIMRDLNVTIEGHTDSTGSAEYNQGLSERRAASVLEFLGQQGISTNRLQSAGFGMDRPIASNDTPEGRSRNRRVELVIGDRAS